jgi:putative ABC transport system substrate-binding protein
LNREFADPARFFDLSHRNWGFAPVAAEPAIGVLKFPVRHRFFPVFFSVHAKEEIEGVMAAQAHTPGGGLIAMPDPFTDTNHDLIIALAARYSVPTVFYDPLFAESGGLIAYGTDFAELFREAAEYIGRVLKGAKPGELPIQQPTKYELVINLETAKALGLTIPESVLSLADKVIE